MQKKSKEQSLPDLTSVRTLIHSVSKLAKHLDLTVNAVYRWIEVNRIPGKHVVRVANFYDVEVGDLLPLTGSDKSHKVRTRLKGKNVLPALLEVYRGNKTLEEACAEVDLPTISGKLVMTHWGDELPTLYTTLEQLHDKRISLETAMQRLNVSKVTLHDLRRKYGYAPRSQEGYAPREKPGGRRTANWENAKAIALQVIAGKATAADFADSKDAPSYRSIFRYIEKLTPLKLNELTHWPDAFRAALAEELTQDMPGYAEKWVNFAKEARLFLRKTPKYMVTPKSWKGVPVKRLIVAVLLGEATIAEVAKDRGGDPKVFADLFTSDLRPLGLTFDEVTSLPMTHQVALAELLLAILDRRRRFIQDKSQKNGD